MSELSKIHPKDSGLLICDRIITEEGTKKKSLIGIFENIYSPSFPCIHGALSVYTKLSDAEGDYEFRLELYDLQHDRKIGGGRTPLIRIETRTHVHELVFNLVGLVFEHEGKYEFRLFANEKNVSSRLFSVCLIKLVEGREGNKNA